MPLRCRRELRQVGFRHRWRRRIQGRHACFADEFREAAAVGHQEDPRRRLPFDAESVGYPARAKSIVAFARADSLAVDDNSMLPSMT